MAQDTMNRLRGSPFQSLLPKVQLLLVVALTACAEGNGGKSATQVAARVNGDEISIHQINDALNRTPGLSVENAEETKQRILSKLIDRQLAVQHAQEMKLHRTPAVVLAIESARHDILARAYFAQLGAGQSKPGEAEAKAYYDAHPELFAERKVFTLRELLIPGRADLLPLVKEQVAQGKSMDAIEGWLKGKDVKFAANSGVRPAEQIPLEILPTLHAMKEGGTTVRIDAHAITVTHVVSSQTKPVDFAAALAPIERFLANQKASELAKQSLTKLRADAKIEYLGVFAGAGPTTIPSLPQESETNGVSPAHFEKGIAGLK